MSLLTRCPLCAAVYQVADEQLDMSGGWVRCGQCAHVFEATAHPIAPVVLEPTVALEPAIAPPHATPSTAQVDVPPEPVSDPPVTLPTDTLAKAEKVAEDVPQQPSTWQPMLVKESAHDAWPQPSMPSTSDVSSASDRSAVWQVPKYVGARQDADRHWGLMLTCAALLLAACVQWLYWDRDRLASMRPELKPMLQALCKPLGCRVSAMQSTDAMVIDASTFTMAGKNSYRIGFVLKNVSLSAVAVPHVELTLTDSLEHVLVRRVLTPAELGSPSEVLAASAQWPVSAVIQLELEQARVLGYHLLAFYP